MNDSYLDPPDYPEPPECCGDIMDVTDDGVCVCPSCGKRIEPQPDIEPVEAVEPEIDILQRRAETAERQLRTLLGIIDAHSVMCFSCDRDGEQFCDCLQRAVEKIKAEIARTPRSNQSR